MRDRLSTSVLAKGRWPRILRALGVPPKALSGRHGPCLFCGGKDRARFTDYKETGSYFCNQCGNYPGFQLLMKLHGWTFKQAADEIDKLLVGSAYVSTSHREAFAADEVRVPRSTQQCALWLRKYHPERLEGWLDLHSPEVRWWLAERETL